MKLKPTFFAALLILSIASYAWPIDHTTSDSERNLQASSIGIDWLTGDQPKLLIAMANTSSMRETLNGTSMNIGTIIGGWHAQAVGQYKDYIYVGFSDGKLWSDKIPVADKNPSNFSGKLWIYNTKTQESKLVDLEKGYPHPCSIQITGKYLTVAVEAEYGTSQAALGAKRVERSVVQIFDLEKDPNCSFEVSRIEQGAMNCAGAGLAFNPQLKCWFMLVDQDFSNGRVAIYKTANENINSWQKDPIAYYPRFGAGAGLNLITASDNSIWGLWYDNSPDNLPTFSKWDIGADQVKLFKLLTPEGQPVPNRDIYTQVVSIGAPKIKGAGELLADHPGMRFGGGLRYENGKLELLTCQRNMDTNFNITRTPINEGSRTQVTYVNFARAKGEIACSSQSDPSQTYKVQKNTTESWNMTLKSPIRGDLNYMTLTKSLTSLPKWVDAIDVKSSAPMVLFYLEGETEIKGSMKEFYAAKASDQLKTN